MKRFRIRWLLPLLVLGIAVVIARAMIMGRDAPPRAHHEQEPPAVNAVVVDGGPVRARIMSQGQVQPLRQINLLSEVSGRIIEVSPMFRTGALVSAGTVLLTIDPIDYEVALADAKAALAAAELTLADVKVLRKTAAIAEAEARVRAAKTRIQQAEADLANTRISVPFDAVIDSRNVDLGQYVRPADALMRLLGTATAEVRLPITSSDLPYAEYGQRADGSWPTATLAASFGERVQTWQARLLRLENRVDPTTRAYYIVGEIDRPYDAGLHGMALNAGVFVSADIEGRVIDDARRLPRATLHGDTLYRIGDDSRLQADQVEVLRFEQDDVIVRGLSPGDRVLANRIDMMVDGREVRVMTGDAE